MLPGSAVALGRYEVTVGECRAFAAATGSRAATGCWGPSYLDGNNGERSWRNPGFPQTDRHPATCVSWDDAQAYASWLSRTTEALYRLPTPDDLTAPAEGNADDDGDPRGECVGGGRLRWPRQQHRGGPRRPPPREPGPATALVSDAGGRCPRPGRALLHGRVFCPPSRKPKFVLAVAAAQLGHRRVAVRHHGLGQPHLARLLLVGASATSRTGPASPSQASIGWRERDFWPTAAAEISCSLSEPPTPYYTGGFSALHPASRNACSRWRRHSSDTDVSRCDIAEWASLT